MAPKTGVAAKSAKATKQRKLGPITPGKVDKNVPLPPYTKAPKIPGVKDTFVDDLKKCAPGDSVAINREFNRGNLNSLRSRVNGAKAKPENKMRNWKFTCNEDPVNPGKMRVWRLL